MSTRPRSKNSSKDDAGNLTAAVISHLKPERDPETGRTNMVPTGEEFTYNCELAFIAAGFVGCESYVADAFGVSLTGAAAWTPTASAPTWTRCSPAAICAGARALSSGACAGPRLRR